MMTFYMIMFGQACLFVAIVALVVYFKRLERRVDDIERKYIHTPAKEAVRRLRENWQP